MNVERQAVEVWLKFGWSPPMMIIFFSHMHDRIHGNASCVQATCHVYVRTMPMIDEHIDRRISKHLINTQQKKIHALKTEMEHVWASTASTYMSLLMVYKRHIIANKQHTHTVFTQMISSTWSFITTTGLLHVDTSTNRLKSCVFIWHSTPIHWHAFDESNAYICVNHSSYCMAVCKWWRRSSVKNEVVKSNNWLEWGMQERKK